jgi:hypothetical protein
MASKKKDDALAVVDPDRYAITKPQGVGDLATLLQGGVGVFDMTRMKVPGSGGTQWEIDGLRGTEYFPDVEGVVILVQGNQRAWWRSPYGSGGGNTPPDCSSTTGRQGKGNINLAVHDDERDDEQGVHDCMPCPWNAWKTAKKPDGSPGRGKACKEFAMVFLYRPGSRTPTMLTVPPTSLKSMRKYSIALLDAGLDVCSVVTRVRLEKEKNADGTEFSKCVFEYVGDLPEDAAAEAKKAEAILADYLATHTITIGASELHGDSGNE